MPSVLSWRAVAAVDADKSGLAHVIFEFELCQPAAPILVVAQAASGGGVLAHRCVGAIVARIRAATDIDGRGCGAVIAR